jgi:hypothetical protein
VVAVVVDRVLERVATYQVPADVAVLIRLGIGAAARPQAEDCWWSSNIPKRSYSLAEWVGHDGAIVSDAGSILNAVRCSVVHTRGWAVAPHPPGWHSPSLAGCCAFLGVEIDLTTALTWHRWRSPAL